MIRNRLTSDIDTRNIVRRARPFPKLFHVDGVVRLPTFQSFLNHLSGLYLVVIVPPFHFLDNLSMELNVLHRWFALLHLLLRNVSRTQVVLGADGPEIVPKTTKQTCFCVTLLLTTLTRERTFQNNWSPFLILVYCSPLVFR